MLRALISMLYLLLLLAAVVVFYLWHQRNTVLVEIDYFTGSMQLPLSFAILIAFILGMIPGICLFWLALAKSKIHLALLRRRLAAADRSGKSVPAATIVDSNTNPS